MDRDLLRSPPSSNFVIPGWLDEKRILEIIDALNRGSHDSDDDDDDSSGGDAS